MRKYYSDITSSSVDGVLASILRQVQADNDLLKGWKVTSEYSNENGKKMKPATFYKKGGFFVVKFRKKVAYFDNYYQDKTQYRRLNRFTDEYEVAGDVYKSGNGKGWKGWAEVEHNQFEE